MHGALEATLVSLFHVLVLLDSEWDFLGGVILLWHSWVALLEITDYFGVDWALNPNLGNSRNPQTLGFCLAFFKSGVVNLLIERVVFA